MAISKSTVSYLPIPGFPGYCVGDDGTIWSSNVESLLDGIVSEDGTQWRLMRPHHLKKGYRIITLKRNGQEFKKLVHRLVLEAFAGPCPDGMEACHNDGNLLNNMESNLRWDTRSANHLDKRAHGTSARGMRNPQYKLTDEDVREIKRMLILGYGQDTIAFKFNISQSNVSMISSGKTWSHIDVDYEEVVSQDASSAD
jgi:hypothetical protein